MWAEGEDGLGRDCGRWAGRWEIVGGGEGQEMEHLEPHLLCIANIYNGVSGADCREPSVSPTARRDGGRSARPAGQGAGGGGEEEDGEALMMAKSSSPLEPLHISHGTHLFGSNQ